MICYVVMGNLVGALSLSVCMHNLGRAGLRVGWKKKGSIKDSHMKRYENWKELIETRRKSGS